MPPKQGGTDAGHRVHLIPQSLTAIPTFLPLCGLKGSSSLEVKGRDSLVTSVRVWINSMTYYWSTVRRCKKNDLRTTGMLGRRQAQVTEESQVCRFSSQLQCRKVAFPCSPGSPTSSIFSYNDGDNYNPWKCKMVAQLSLCICAAMDRGRTSGVPMTTCDFITCFSYYLWKGTALLLKLFFYKI